MLPIYDPKRITDFNTEGFDSVESEDFEIGFGCVVAEKTQESYLPPPMIDTRTPEEKAESEERLRWFYMTEEEKQQMDYEYLQSHGIDFDPRQKH